MIYPILSYLIISDPTLLPLPSLFFLPLLLSTIPYPILFYFSFPTYPHTPNSLPISTFRLLPYFPSTYITILFLLTSSTFPPPYFPSPDSFLYDSFGGNPVLWTQWFFHQLCDQRDDVLTFANNNLASDTDLNLILGMLTTKMYNIPERKFRLVSLQEFLTKKDYCKHLFVIFPSTDWRKCFHTPKSFRSNSEDEKNACKIKKIYLSAENKTCVPRFKSN